MGLDYASGWRIVGIVNTKTHTQPHNHKLVIYSLKRGQYLVNLLTMANGDIDSTWSDGDNINAAIEFGALYSESDLRALADSQGPDWEVQPADLFEPQAE